MIITSKIQFDNEAAKLAGRMVSEDAATRTQAAFDTCEMLAFLPKDIANNPHISTEVDALNKLILQA